MGKHHGAADEKERGTNQELFHGGLLETILYRFLRTFGHEIISYPWENNIYPWGQTPQAMPGGANRPVPGKTAAKLKEPVTYTDLELTKAPGRPKFNKMVIFGVLL
jgi:hypothetical protein